MTGADVDKEENKAPIRNRVAVPTTAAARLPDKKLEQKVKIFEEASYPDKVIAICDLAVADLVLQLSTVRYKYIDYHISSTRLLLSSSVFEAMLSSPSPRQLTVERYRSADGEVRDYLRIFDDDPEVLLLFLRVIHMQYDKVPESLSMDQLIQLADFCGKYDCVKVFDAWRAQWLEPWWKSACSMEQAPWLKVAVVFGEPGNFASLTQAIIKDVGPLLVEDGYIVANTLTARGFNIISPHIPENLRCELSHLIPPSPIGILIPPPISSRDQGEARYCFSRVSHDRQEIFALLETFRTCRRWFLRRCPLPLR